MISIKLTGKIIGQIKINFHGDVSMNRIFVRKFCSLDQQMKSDKIVFVLILKFIFEM